MPVFFQSMKRCLSIPLPDAPLLSLLLKMDKKTARSVYCKYCISRVYNSQSTVHCSLSEYLNLFGTRALVHTEVSSPLDALHTPRKAQAGPPPAASSVWWRSASSNRAPHEESGRHHPKKDDGTRAHTHTLHESMQLRRGGRIRAVPNTRTHARTHTHAHSPPLETPTAPGVQPRHRTRQ
jgi:hypothetical protein